MLTTSFTFSPSLIPDKVYTVYLNVTSQRFTEPLKDLESLEFLNLAEKIQVAVTKDHILRLKKQTLKKQTNKQIWDLSTCVFLFDRYRLCLLTCHLTKERKLFLSGK